MLKERAMNDKLRKIFSKDHPVGENVRTLAIALFIVLLIRSSIAAPYKIPTGSMIPTLKIGDHIFVSKLSYGLKLPFTNWNLTTWDKPIRGDVVVFKYPENPKKDFIKRVIGIPGDRIEIREGQLYVNGEPIKKQPLDEKTLLKNVEAAQKSTADFNLYLENIGEKEHFILHSRDYFVKAFGDKPPVVVKEGHYFVMGDNRDNSKDSREWGFVSFEAIRGRAQVVFFSLKKNPWGIRWNRFGKVIR
jgi:signal peptidase I